MELVLYKLCYVIIMLCYLTQVVFPFFPRTHWKLYLLVHLIFQRIHLTPNYCLCCSVIASYKSSGIWAWQAYLCPKHTTVLLNHGHVRNKFVALSLRYWYFISWVLSFAVLARQYFPGFYFCDFNRQIWKEGIKFFWQKPGPLKTSR